MEAGVRRLVRAAVLSGAIVWVCAGQAEAATTIGETFEPTGATCTPGGTTYLQSGPAGYTAPSDGVITSWSHRTSAEAQPQLKLKVGRAAAGESFLIVGESAFQPLTPNALNTFPAQIAVETGDAIGFTLGGDGGCYRGLVGESFQYYSFDTDPAPGATVPSGPVSTGIQFDISANLEPDCDGDGLGDETQDADLTSCPPPVDTDDPETTITKDAPKKTDATRVKFKFRSDEVGSTFECKLDKKPFKACSSPKTVKRLDEGKHRFQVRAIDAAGNPDPTPDKDKFKVIG